MNKIPLLIPNHINVAINEGIANPTMKRIDITVCCSETSTLARKNADIINAKLIM